MNKLLLYITLSAFILFADCKPDKEPTAVTPQTQENSIKKLLLGKWRVQFTATDWNRNGIPDQDEKEFQEEQASITFNIDGTLTMTDEQSGQSEEGSTNWSLNDKELILTDAADSFSSGDSEPYTIVSLTTIDMLWSTPEDSASLFFIGFTKE